MDPSNRSDATAAQVIAELLAGGEEVDEGGFTLDPAAAVAKLEAFAYPDRSRYLIPIVEGLLGLGAQRITIETRGGHQVIQGRGVELQRPGEQLGAIYSFAFGRSADRSGAALGRLAVGLDMVLGGAGPATPVRLRYQSSAAGVEVECRRRTPPVVATCERLPSTMVAVLSVTVGAPWHVLASTGPMRRLAVEHLRAAVRFSSAPIDVNGRRVSQAPRDWWTELRDEGPGYRVSGGLEQADEPPSSIELWSQGVRIETLPADGRAFTGVVELDAPRRDLSQLRVVRDATVERALAAVASLHREALAQLARDEAGWTVETRPRPWHRRRVERVLGRGPDPKPGVRAEPVQRTTLALMWALLPLHGLVLTYLGLASALVVWSGLLFVPWVVGQRIVAWLVAPSLLTLGLASLVRPLKVVWRVLGLRRAGLRMPARITGVTSSSPRIGSSPAPASSAGPSGGSAELELAWQRELTALQSSLASTHRSGAAELPSHGQLEWAFTDPAGVERWGRSLPRPAGELVAWALGDWLTIVYDPAHPEESWWEADVGTGR